MKKILLSIITLFSLTSYAQVTAKINGDTTRLYKINGGNNELIIENSTRNKTLGFLQNIGNGRTRFSLAIDSIYRDSFGLRFRYGANLITIPLKDSSGEDLQRTTDVGYKTTNRIIASGFGGPDSTSRTLFYIGDTLPAGGMGWKFQYSNGTYTAIGGRSPVGPTVYGMWAGKMSLQNNVSNTILGSGGAMDLVQEGNTLVGQVVARRAKTIWRNALVGQGSMQFAWTGDLNSLVGVFAGETASGALANAGVGNDILRAIRGGSYNAAFGSSVLTAATTVVDTIIITNPGSGYSSSDTVMTISSPEYDPATGILISTPGVGQVQATAIATITGGSVTAVRVTNRGKGYSTEKAPVTASLTGSGSGASFTISLRHTESMTAVGRASFFGFINGKRDVGVGTWAGNRLTFGDDNIFIGSNSGNVDGQRDTIDNSMAIGPNTYTTASNQIVFGNSSHNDLRIRGIVQGSGTVALRYDPATQKVTYGDTSSVSSTPGFEDVVNANGNVATDKVITAGGQDMLWQGFDDYTFDVDSFYVKNIGITVDSSRFAMAVINKATGSFAKTYWTGALSRFGKEDLRSFGSRRFSFSSVDTLVFDSLRAVYWREETGANRLIVDGSSGTLGSPDGLQYIYATNNDALLYSLYGFTERYVGFNQGQAKWKGLTGQHNAADSMVVYNPSTNNIGFRPIPSGGGFSNPMTDVGDIIRGGSGGVAEALPVGTSGQVLTVSDGLPTWLTPSSGVAQSVITDSLQNYWRLSGNTIGNNQFIGSTNNRSVTFRANNTNYLSLDSNGLFRALDRVSINGYVPASGNNAALMVRSLDNSAACITLANASNYSTKVDLHPQGISASAGFRITSIGNDFEINSAKTYVGGASVATAKLHIAAGGTGANTAPLKFTSGSLNSTAEAGAVEFLTDKWYATISTGAARKELTLNDAALTPGVIPVATTNGRLTDGYTMSQLFGAGTYTPTLTNVANIGSSTAHVFQYSWVRDPTSGLQVVTVSGYVDVDPTMTMVDTKLRLTVPILTGFADEQEARGTAAAKDIAGQSAAILAEASTGTVIMEWVAGDITSKQMSIQFTYKVTPP